MLLIWGKGGGWVKEIDRGVEKERELEKVTGMERERA